MNFLAKSVMNIARTCVASSIQGSQSTLTKFCGRNYTSGSVLSIARVCMTTALQGIAQIRSKTSLSRLHRCGPHRKVRQNDNPFGAGTPFMKGIILKTIIKKPKKPNSANRKCVVVRLTNGKEMTAYVPGVGHNLQEHNIVLCRVGRLQDTPGVKIKCVRGKYDLPHDEEAIACTHFQDGRDFRGRLEFCKSVGLLTHFPSTMPHLSLPLAESGVPWRIDGNNAVRYREMSQWKKGRDTHSLRSPRRYYGRVVRPDFAHLHPASIHPRGH